MLIESTVELRAPSGSRSLQHDVVVRPARRAEYPGQGSEVLFESLEADGTAWQTVERIGGQYRVSYADTAVFTILQTLDEVEYQWLGAEDGGTGQILLEGFVLGLLAGLRGALVLHASAVELPDGRALAFIGPSGTGKSTMAALLTRAGCRLLADDVVAVEFSDPPGSVRIHSGIQVARLRRSAWELGQDRKDTSIGISVDERMLVQADELVSGSFELAAIWIPSPDREASEAVISPLSLAESFREILSNMRVQMNDAGSQLRGLDSAARLLAEIPVSTLTAPWGPPWLDSHTDDIIAMIRQEIR